MRINSINNLSFGKVYAVIGTKKQLENLEKSTSSFQEKEKLSVMRATELYENSPVAGGLCSKAVKEGKEVDFYVTGKNVHDVRFMEFGWGSINGVSRHIDSAYTIQDDKKAADYFNKKIQLDWKNDKESKNAQAAN